MSSEDVELAGAGAWGPAHACVCHGWLPSSGRPHEGRGGSWLRSAKVHLDMMRPLLALVVARAQAAEKAVPDWSDSDVERIPLAAVDRWLAEISATLREPALGLLALDRVRRGAGHVIELAAECAPSLGAALLVLARQLSTVNDAASLHLYVQGPTAILAIESRVRVSRVLRDYFNGWLSLTVARWLGSSAELVLSFAGERPTYAHVYRQVLGDVALSFGASCDALILPASKLNVALPRANPKQHAFLLQVARHIEARSTGTRRVWTCS